MNDLIQQLRTEIAKRDRIAERLHSVRVALDEAERDIRHAQGEVETEMTTAAIEERAPKIEGLEKKLAKFRASSEQKKLEQAGAETALRQQGAKVEAIEAEIASRAHLAAREIVTPLARRAVEIQNELAGLAEKIFEATAPFPWALEVFPGVSTTEAGLRTEQLRSALRMKNWLSRYTTDSIFSREYEHAGAGIFIPKSA